MQGIPALRLSYSNLLLRELARRGPATLEELLDVPDVEQLFKSERAHRNPAGRVQDVLRFAMLVGLATKDGSQYSLSQSGLAYADAVQEADPWSVTEDQAAIIRAFICSGEPGMAADAILALAVQRQLDDEGRNCSAEDFGRLLARESHTDQWREARTFESQGARYRALLEEAGLMTPTGQLTTAGTALLENVGAPSPSVEEAQPSSVWWVNQGTTYGKEREGGFIWAPMLNKAGRPQGHWDSMDRVHPQDVILHYSTGSIRAVSVVISTAQPAANPLETADWESNGRIITTRYSDLNDPIALAAIPEKLRIDHGAPFTVNGSVQQGYLYVLHDRLVTEIADRFPELREFLLGYRAPVGPNPALPTITPVEIHESFAGAVAASGLVFSHAGGPVRSFISSLLSKPFVILTGLSGSGKTQLAMRLGEWFGQDDDGRPRHVVIPVRPDWTGPESIFGYEDALRSVESGRTVWHVPEPFEFILRAAVDSTHPYLMVLDEMNLAHVERYFADFLSGLESRRPVLPDLTRGNDTNWERRGPSSRKLPLPRNLFVIGTVNVDETTYMFSPKVLDRASTFEFRVETGMLDPDLGRPSSVAPAPDPVQRGFCDFAEDDEWHRQNPHPEQAVLVESMRTVHEILAGPGLEFGHRTFYESLRFAAFYAAAGDLDPDRALDLILMQKLLPRIHGSRRRIEPVLASLLEFADGGGRSEPRLPITRRKVTAMLDAVRANQFVSFAE